jgi:steroid delta-isomerase-like uncharacterized protein
MMSQQTQAEQNKDLVRRWFAELNKGNLAAADDLYAANYVLHDPGAPPNLPPGPEAVKQFLAPFVAAFPDTQGTIEDLVAEGDKVVVRFTIRGTQQGAFAGMPPTGKAVAMTGISIMRIVDGKFEEEWEIGDTMGMLQQLGAIPTQG